MIFRMGKHSLDDVKARLSELIDRARAGEEVVITRGNKAVARITALDEGEPAPASPRRSSADMIEWLRAHRVKPSVIGDAGKLVREMRDEDAH